MEEKIIIKGARVHNLANIDLELPRNQLIIFSGISGSGKSSLAFDTIFAEGQRRYIESLSPYARQFLGQLDRPDVDEIIGLSPAIAIDQKALSHNPRSTVGTLTEIYDYLRVLFSRLGEVYCPKCGTKIKKISLDEMIDIIYDESKKQLADSVMILAPVVRGRKGEYYQLFYDFLSLGYSEARIDNEFRSLNDRLILSRYQTHQIDIVIDRFFIKEERSRLYEAVENALHYGQGVMRAIFYQGKKALKEIILSSLWTCPNDNFSFPEVEPRLFSFNSPYGACPYCHGLGKLEWFSNEICPQCQGKRLREEALSVKINGQNIYQIGQLSIKEALKFFNDYEQKLTEREKIISENLLKEIKARLGFLVAVGLDYLTLNREAETLSGGEAQRIRLASQIGSGLSGTLYVLDEPTIGLHERDTERLIETLYALKKAQNTLIVVEHDERMIKSGDYMVDLGPLAGRHGGRVVSEGFIKDLIKRPNDFPNSLTLKYLSHQKTIQIGRAHV